MTKPQLFLALTVVLAVAVPAARADTAGKGDAAVLTVSAAGKRALKGVTVGVVAPAKSSKGGLRLPARTVAVAGGVGAVELDGALRFRAGERAVSASALRLSVGSTSSALSGKLGRTRVTLFSARGRATLDGAARSIAVTGARLSLTRAAASKLKRALKLRMTPSAATLGTLSLRAASTAPPPAATPAPAPVVTGAAPTAVATATPSPAPGCGEHFAATPAGSADWFGCDLPGNGDLKSWTNYIERPFAPACGLGDGSVTASGGATRVEPASPYDHRFPVADADVRPDGSATIRLTGSVTYTMPAHGIDETIGALAIEIAPGGGSAEVRADGRSNPRSGTLCPGASTPYAGERVLDVDLAGVTPVTSGGVTRWVHAPARIAAGTTLVGGGQYPAGSHWGSFTIAIPAP